MSNKYYFIAQINIARLREPLERPVNKDFVDNLDRINQVAESAPGFIWRLKDDSGNATGIKIFSDPQIIVNMSVWESFDHLFNYTYRSDHIDVFRRRGEWFTKLESPHLALWWIKREKIPSPDEGREKLKYIEEYGISPFAFTFKQKFSIEEYLKANKSLR